MVLTVMKSPLGYTGADPALEEGGRELFFDENADGAKWCHVSKASLNVVGRPGPTKSATDPALNPLLLYT